MLFRFRAQQAASLGILDLSRTRRPRAITTVTSIPICEKWRGQVLKEISRKVSKIQETSLSDFQIRDLNDEINKLMREKHMWEVQIRGLGGPNYMRGGGRVVDEEGREIEGAGRGYRFVLSRIYLFVFFVGGRLCEELPLYFLSFFLFPPQLVCATERNFHFPFFAQALQSKKKEIKKLTSPSSLPSRYFGRARTLPGVAELFAAKSSTSASEKPLESRTDLRRHVDASYYGYNLDEEDGTLLAYEAQREEEAREEWLQKARVSADGGGGVGGGGKGGGAGKGKGVVGGGGLASKRRKTAESNSEDTSDEEDEEDDDEEEEEDEEKEEYNSGHPPNWEPLPGDAGDGIPWHLPTLEEVSEELVERRRRRLLETLG